MYLYTDGGMKQQRGGLTKGQIEKICDKTYIYLNLHQFLAQVLDPAWREVILGKGIYSQLGNMHWKVDEHLKYLINFPKRKYSLEI